MKGSKNRAGSNHRFSHSPYQAADILIPSSSPETVDRGALSLFLLRQGSLRFFFNPPNSASAKRLTKMNLPLYWRRATFAVSEAAELLGVTEAALRTWLARAPLPDFLGAREDGRIHFSGNDIFYYALVRDLTSFGVGTRVAMLAAAGYANDACDSLPGEYLVVRRSGESRHTFELTYDPTVGDSSALCIPMARLASDLIDRAARASVENAARRTSKAWTREDIEELARTATQRSRQHAEAR